MEVFLHISANLCQKSWRTVLLRQVCKWAVCATENQLWICQVPDVVRVSGPSCARFCCPPPALSLVPQILCLPIGPICQVVGDYCSSHFD